MNPRINPQSVAIAQRSFELVKPNVDAFSRAFYARLFEIDPALEILFPADLEAQRSKLIAMLDSMVAHLSDWDTLLAETQALGARHVEYGAQPHHYVEVGLALIWALERHLGPDFTPEVGVSWREVYDVLFRGMTENTSP
jgi:hemoglobin-like flavoprotein